MVKQHLKRLASPRTWPIAKKTLTFIARPNPGPHKLEHQIPITVFLRDLVELVTTSKEVKHILHNKDCLVDGTICHDNKRPVGLMDVVSLPKAKEHFRLLINKKNTLYAIKISEKEAQIKFCKIANKTLLKKGLMQINTTDGRNFLVKDGKAYAVGDSLQIELPSQKITNHFPLAKGATIILTAGSHVGVIGTVESVGHQVVTVKTKEKTFRTASRFAFVVGKDKSIITV